MKDNNINYIIYLMDSFSESNDFDKKEIDGEIGEQGAPAGGGGGGGTKAPYPTVTKWTSGRKFGPTYNPEQKTWASGLTRGKANTLI
jgi:hypothetical protein